MRAVVGGIDARHRQRLAERACTFTLPIEQSTFAGPLIVTEQPLWQPSAERIAAANITEFRSLAARQRGADFADYADFHRWTVEDAEAFWNLLWDYSGIIAGTKGDRVVTDLDKMPGAQWFPGARLNFAENLLRRRDDLTAMVFHGEGQPARELGYGELYDQVSRLAQALRAEGVVAGDRVAGFMPNMPEAIVAMLAATSIGAVWSSCSPDFGVKGVMDRFGQIEPTVLVTADGYFYNGKAHDSLARIGDIAAQLPSLKRLIVVPYTNDAPDLTGLANATVLDEYIDAFQPNDIEFARLPFNHPLYILYSSGTTGLPKCIVHGAGGTLVKHLSEQRLHCDIKPGTRLFYFTTCGWMMWNWLASALASEATLILYDGSPFYPDGNAMWDLAQNAGVEIFGTSAKFIDACSKEGLKPIETHDLGAVQTILSTGSPLLPESFDYVYADIKRDVSLGSMSGGTDLIGCFAAGDPTAAVWRGEISALVVGMATDVFDDDGNSIRGQKGELVCTRAFPSLPIEFWDDPGDAKYHAAYFEVYDNVWRHGDYCEITEHGGVIIYGRSDAVLNPGGVRIGTAEIYRQVERLDDVVEGLVIGQQWEGDVRVVLFVKLRDGVVLDDDLQALIRKQVRDNATPRHVPARIVAVDDIPRTISGKIVELAVRDIVHGREVRNRDALANPEALELYRDIPALQD
jgi:acetoacetyl-CoA synthetase